MSNRDIPPAHHTSAHHASALLATARSAAGRQALAFGRRRSALRVMVTPDRTTLADDLRLFGNAFIGGLLFMAIYLS